MKFVVQRVSEGHVTIDGQTESIGQGLVVLMGIGKDDSEADCERWVEKLLKLRLFADEAKPINASLKDIQGEILLVSQFTLYGDTKGQNRPSFINAAPPEKAKAIYDHFVNLLKERWPATKTGVFAADMQVKLINDGPVTLLLED